MFKNFMVDCLNKNAKASDLERYVEYWHTHETGNTLKEFLGMSDSEYEQWGKSSDAVVEHFLVERKKCYQKLTDDEYNVLQKISSKTHMDEWFWLEESEDGKDYVRNLDDESQMTLFDGVFELVEGIVNYELCDLSDGEIEAFEGLLSKLQIEADIPRK